MTDLGLVSSPRFTIKPVHCFLFPCLNFHYQGPSGSPGRQPLPRALRGAAGYRDLVAGGPQQARRAQLPQGAQGGGEGNHIFFKSAL